MVHEAEMVHKRIFCCIWPCPSHIVANPKSLLTTHIHSFLHSVSIYWASSMFQAPASAQEIQKLNKTSSSQFGGIGFKMILMVRMAWKYSLKSKCKNWLLTVRRLRKPISQKIYFKCSSPATAHPASHIPTSTQRTGRHLKLRGSVKQTLPHATWLSCSRWHQETWGFQDVPSCQPSDDVFEMPISGALQMSDIYKVSFSSLNQKVPRFLLASAPPASA